MLHLRLYWWVLAGMLLPGMLVAAPQAQPAAVRHVVLISVDGLRPDAITPAGAHEIEALTRRGAYTAVARTTKPPVTLSAHTSMLTGLDTSIHGVVENDERPGYIQRPTLFTRARDAGFSSAAFLGKHRLVFLIPPGSADEIVGPDSGDANWARGAATALADAFARSWPVHRYKFTFIHLREPDRAGHKHGFMSEPYMHAVREADQAIGSMMRTIAASGVAGQTAVIVTSDHGGFGTTHWEDHAEDYVIPWLCVVPGAAHGARLDDRAITVYDTAPTIAALLNLPPVPVTSGTVVTDCLPAAPGR